MNAQTKEAISGELVEVKSDPWNVPAPVIQTESAALYSLIERAMADPNFDLVKLDRLIALKEKVEKENQRKLFNAAMADAQAEIQPVAARAKNTHTSSTYATLDAIGKEIDPIITKHGFSLSFGLGEGAPSGSMRVTYKVAHREGFEERGHADIPTDAAGAKGGTNKTATHAFGSTVTYGRRYLTCMIFNVKWEKDDDGNAAGRKAETEKPLITEDQIKALRDLLEATDSDEAKFCQRIGVPSLAEIYADKYMAACALIRQKMERRAS